MPRDGWLWEPGEGSDEFPRGSLTRPQEVENPSPVGVGDSGEDRVAPDFFVSHSVYDQEDFEGSWLIEKRFPSGSEKVAEIPQVYSSG